MPSPVKSSAASSRVMSGKVRGLEEPLGTGIVEATIDDTCVLRRERELNADRELDRRFRWWDTTDECLAPTGTMPSQAAMWRARHLLLRWQLWVPRPSAPA